MNYYEKKYNKYKEKYLLLKKLNKIFTNAKNHSYRRTHWFW